MQYFIKKNKTMKIHQILRDTNTSFEEDKIHVRNRCLLWRSATYLIELSSEVAGKWALILQTYLKVLIGYKKILSKF